MTCSWIESPRGVRCLLALLLAGGLLAGCRSMPLSGEPGESEGEDQGRLLEPPPRSLWTVTSSAPDSALSSAQAICDGLGETRWSSPSFESHWIQMDLGRLASVCGLTIYWESADAREYEIQLSDTAETWTPVYRSDRGEEAIDEFFFAPRTARFIRMASLNMGGGAAFSIREVEVKGPSEQWRVKVAGVPSASAIALLDGSLQTLWRSDGALPCVLELDMRRERVLGGLRLDWGHNHATRLSLSMSSDQENWKLLDEVRDGTGLYDLLMQTSATGRYLRLEFLAAALSGPVEVRDVSIRHYEQGVPPLDLYEMAAEKAAPGWYPEALRNRQVYWTVMGVPGGSAKSLLDEYGNLEPSEGSCSLMPYLWVDGRLLSASSASLVRTSLEDGFLPLPSVAWEFPGLRMNVSAYSRGGPDSSMTFVRYQVQNTSTNPRTGRLFLSVRPAQINPPWLSGGLADVREMSFEAAPEWGIVHVNRQPYLYLLNEPARFGVRAFDRGDIVRDLAAGELPATSRAESAWGLLSGAAEYPFDLAPTGEWVVVVAAPLDGGHGALYPFLRDGPGKVLAPGQAFEKRLNEMRWYWREKLGSVEFRVPDSNVVNSLWAQAGQLLVQSVGPVLYSGSRSGSEASIHEGCMAVAALLRMGLSAPARRYLDWYGLHLQPDGTVPPVVSRTGALPAPTAQEAMDYRSQAQWVFAVMEYYRFTQDRAFLEKHDPSIRAALERLAQLRTQTLGEAYQAGQPVRERFLGILPSASHGPGKAPPLHRYEDDFWALKGWTDGRSAAEVLGNQAGVAEAERQGKALRKALADSIQQAMNYLNIKHIPACAEAGGLDPFAAARIFFPCGEENSLPMVALQNTFDAYYRQLLARQRTGWVGSFSPSECQIMNGLVGLGRTDYAQQLAQYLLAFRRPSGWQGWAGLCLSQPRQGGYVGDMPNSFVGSEWINAVRGMLAQEKGESLFLLEGVPLVWLQNENGVLLRNAPTHFGRLNLKATVVETTLNVELDGELSAPGGLHLFWPLDGAPEEVLVDGEPWVGYDEWSCRLPASARKISARWPSNPQ